VYDDIVRPGDGLDPGSFRPVDIAEKETAATVWVHVPGYRYPPDPGRQVRSDAPPAHTPRARSRAGAYLTDRWTIVVAVALGGAATAGVAALSGGPLPAAAIGASAAAVCYAVTAAAGVLTDPLLRPRRLHRSAPSSTDPVPAERADDDGRVEPSTAVTG